MLTLPHEWEYRIIPKPYNKGKAVQKYHTCGLELDLEWMCLECGLCIRQTLREPDIRSINAGILDKAMSDADWKCCRDE